MLSDTTGKEQLVMLSNLAGAHERAGARLSEELTWDGLADAATVLLLLVGGLQRTIEARHAGSAKPNLMVASMAVRAADRDLQWVRERTTGVPLTDGCLRVRMAWHNIGHALAALRVAQGDATHVA